MKLIPVIDLMHGIVVTAKCGKRETYAPSNTPLCGSSDATKVLSALLKLYPFETCYIADLDAITGAGSNLELIHDLHLAYPGLELWLDNGLRNLNRVGEFARPVVGTESLVNIDKPTHLIASLSNPVLSLDFVEDRLVGLTESDFQLATWPQDVIIMSLSRVGSSCGPETQRLGRLLAQRPTLNYYVAGGIRNLQDLEQVRALGAAGVLLSTALHKGQIGREEFGRFFKAHGL